MAMSTIREHFGPYAQIYPVRVRNIGTLNSESDAEAAAADDGGNVMVIYRCSCLIGQSICCCLISAKISPPQPRSATYRRYLPTLT